MQTSFAPFYRPNELWGRNGIFRVSRSKFCKDYLVRPSRPELKLIPGTTVERIKTVPLGEQAVAVTGAEVKRVAEALSAQVTSDEPVPRQRSTRR